MMDDPIVEQVHQARQRILAECEGDLGRLIARLKAGDSLNQDRLVSAEEIEKRSEKPRTAGGSGS